MPANGSHMTRQCEHCNTVMREQDGHQLDIGWVNIIWFAEDDDQAPWDFDFCSLGCLADWATAKTTPAHASP